MQWYYLDEKMQVIAFYFIYLDLFWNQSIYINPIIKYDMKTLKQIVPKNLLLYLAIYLSLHLSIYLHSYLSSLSIHKSTFKVSKLLFIRIYLSIFILHIIYDLITHKIQAFDHLYVYLSFHINIYF